MLKKILAQFFPSANDRFIRRIMPTIEAINARESEVQKLTDAQLKERTDLFRTRIAGGESLNDILVDAFATVREASVRSMGLRQYDVQLAGGIILHKGMIAEMRTGEGKTLMSVAPIYLNALAGKGVHVVTVNDYLAARDAHWMKPVYDMLGIHVGIITHTMFDDERRAAYAADITYGTNNEFGFDYLRDNMKFRLDDMVQRTFNYAVVDEVDNILIDEARTPLIISGAAEKSSDLYTKADKLIGRLVETDYKIDEKAHSVVLTEQGQKHVEDLVREHGLIEGENLYDVHNIALVHHVDQALRANTLYRRDKDYIVKDGAVVIIDEFTGRMADGRRYSDGLHQAIEAKEKVAIQLENQTLASVTYQNYFRLYPKLAGMTGTALTEAAEFSEIYNLDVVSVPTHRPLRRVDGDDEVYRTFEEKFVAIKERILAAHEARQPVLVGTTSIEKSELISRLLKEKNIPHQVLNARFHEKEAEIIAQAGKPGAITIATNMAGRGTDIKLGGSAEIEFAKRITGEESPNDLATLKAKITAEIAANEKIAREAGGLLVIGTERHESRRIDNQLRGRAGRQGDPGESIFYLSLGDDLMRIFGSDRLDATLVRLGLKEGEAIRHRWVTKALERAQKRVEARHFDVRKQLLKYDDVMNDQRKVIYQQRRDIMTLEDISDTIVAMREEAVRNALNRCIAPRTFPEEWPIELIGVELKQFTNEDFPLHAWITEAGMNQQVAEARVLEFLNVLMATKEKALGSEAMRKMERLILLRVLDQTWKDHLAGLDHLRQGIHLRAYGQKDPLNEYKHEAFAMFQTMLTTIQESATQLLALFTVDKEAIATLQDEMFEDDVIDGTASNPDAEEFLSGGEHESTDHNESSDHWEAYIPRNSPCPCGSAKRYKHCCGR
ncbi:MAG: preprotein translocase subunit SecA [Alphaproteobacteria bacterium]|nr:MAG: preprotein translocase subunit SecA [Alphaproteobacteria bacterium]